MKYDQKDENLSIKAANTTRTAEIIQIAMNQGGIAVDTGHEPDDEDLRDV